MKKRALPSAAPRRRRGRTRLFAIGVASLAAATALPAPSAAAQQGAASTRSTASRFDIKPGLLGDVIAQFERSSGVTVTLADAGLASLQSPGVNGSYTPQEAMNQILRGLGVTVAFDGQSARLAVRPVNEFVEVGASARAQSPKYREALRDTPQTMVVVPQQVFQEQGATSLRDVLRNTPGVTMSIGEGASGVTAMGDNVLIRGFSARNDIYIDGARDPGEIARDAFNVEVVEVAKGPSSVTGGRGVTGGSINMVTKSANLTNRGTVQFAVGSADHKRAQLDVNRRLSKTVAVRLNGMWQDSGYPGRDVQLNRSWGFAPSVGFGLNTSHQLVVGYARLKQNNVPDLGLPTLFPDTAVARHLTVNDLDFSNYYGIASRDYEHTTSDQVTATYDHRFNQTFSARNLTRFGRNFRDAVQTPPRPTAATTGNGPGDPGYDPTAMQLRRTDTKYHHRDDRVTTNQTDLMALFSTGKVLHNADVGLELAYDHQPTYAFTDLFTNGRPPVVDLLNPDPYVAYTPAYAKTGASTDGRAYSAAAYAFDTLHFGDHWQADLGLRFDRVKMDYDNVATTGVLTEFGRTDRAVTGRSGVVYKPVAWTSLYAAYSTSFNPTYDQTHGLQLSATGATNQALPPERSHNVEGGIKWEPLRSLAFTAAVFQMEKTNAKTVDPSGATVLAGNQSVVGAEAGISGNITPRWGAFGGVAVMNGEVKESLDPVEEGNQLPWVPRVSANLWTTYRLLVGNGLTVGGGVNYNSGHYFNTRGFEYVANRFDARYTENAAAIQALTKYTVFNAMVSYPVTPRLQLQVNAYNLGNTKYADRAYDRHFLPGPARSIVFTPVISF